MKRAVFLDRDGVLNRAFVRDNIPYPPRTVREIDVLPGVAESLNTLKSLDLSMVVVTNQPDVARGTQTRDVIEHINRTLVERLPIDAVYVCYHDNADACSCRKPKDGMLRTAAAELGLDLANSFMVGDRWSDIAVGKSAGCKTFLVARPYSQAERCRPDHTVADLAEAASIITRIVSPGDRYGVD